ncbi:MULTISPECIES: ribonuclease HI [unclassified Halomonas]|uniref:ribonuclease HI n=1 Tax=unclassified Halomonas TaxID=2609666 RepID=UPI002888CB0A|nr:MULTISPECIES: ribonuclease HI [unclassified Halomonas]MDT0500313.1 ribonuclease HI [Halomonas sp. PAR7]MDT0511190.1 ribonuclease HI [Halomonas sp. LES1]MDT0590521.1 ribonuclease HI [Halomonas sp. PAR8]
MTIPSITIYTDGACPNNGSEFASGGWAAVLEASGKQLRISGHETPSTNNRMELTAILEGLKAINAECAKVVLYTDSAYARNGCKTWRHDWKRRGWRRAKNKPVENVDLWREIDQLLERHEVEIRWVKGHSGHPQNELADRLAVAASRGQTVSQYRKEGDYRFSLKELTGKKKVAEA